MADNVPGAGDSAAAPRHFRIIELHFGRTAWGMLFAALVGAILGFGGSQYVTSLRTERLKDPVRREAELAQAMLALHTLARGITDEPVRSSGHARQLLNGLRAQRDRLSTDDAHALLTVEVVDLAHAADALERAERAEERRRQEGLASTEPVRSQDPGAPNTPQRLMWVFAQTAAEERQRADYALRRIKLRSYMGPSLASIRSPPSASSGARSVSTSASASASAPASSASAPRRAASR